MSVSVPWGGGSGGYLPLNQPMVQTIPLVPHAPQSRAIGKGFFDGSGDSSFTQTQLQSLLRQIPMALLSQGAAMASQASKGSKTTTASPTTTSTTTTTTTPRPRATQRPFRHTTARSNRRVGQFHYGSLESREDFSMAVEDDAIVFLVGLFNLLAVVVYAAQKFVAGDREGLSERVIQWQVQKVLDELVLKVHSSQYVAELLSRSMPNTMGYSETGRSINHPWENVIAQAQSNGKSNATAWLRNLKDKIIAIIGNSPAALKTVRINSNIYLPIENLFDTLTTPDGLVNALDGLLGEEEGEVVGRALVSRLENVPKLIDTASQLTLDQVQSTFRALTLLGRAQNRFNVFPFILRILSLDDTEDPSAKFNRVSRMLGFEDSNSEETTHSRVVREANPSSVVSASDHFSPAMLSYLRRAKQLGASPKHDNQDERTGQDQINRRPIFPNQRRSKYSRHPSRRQQIQGRRPMAYQSGKYRYSRRYGSPRRPLSSASSSSSQSSSSNLPAQSRMGVVENESAAADSGHWTDRWFSLVTQVSPVGLDMSTLYARARARPQCLRALLCRANNAWRKIGPVQAALTPFSSVLVSWVLEDTAPHSLGDSLIAVRAGWMGKDCNMLYPECPLHPDPHPAAKEAITFFSRLQHAATQNSHNIIDNDFSGQRPFRTNINDISGPRPITDDQDMTSNSKPNYHQRPYDDNDYTGSRPYHNEIERDPQGGTDFSDSRPYQNDMEYTGTIQRPIQQKLASNDFLSLKNNINNYGVSNSHGESNSYSNEIIEDIITTHSPLVGTRKPYHRGEPSSSHNKNREPPSNIPENIPPSAALTLYYDRYGGKGPVSVSGQHHDNAQKTGGAQDRVDRVDAAKYTTNKPYNKYESPQSNPDQMGEISGSNSVSGMVLQDRPTAGHNFNWNKQYEAGIFGGNVQHSNQYSKEKAESNSGKQPQKYQYKKTIDPVNKIGAIDEESGENNHYNPPSFLNQPGYTNYLASNNRLNSNINPDINNIPKQKPKRPYFSLPSRVNKNPRPSTPSTSSNEQASPSKKYKYGLRRGLPAGNVNNNYNNGANIYQPAIPWYAYTTGQRQRFYRPTTPSGTPKKVTATTTTTTTTTTTENPLASKDIQPFGPKDAVTDVLRNELLYEYIRDRQGSIPLEERRSRS
ncbi:unnamed protein product [Meganyctiphanes norvegica]|uniref:Uncharacterized protein n=1 Tax=Meganyctiphanes norvegica TaxID=48144 RepID=A0AAV2RK77_MEGNR